MAKNHPTATLFGVVLLTIAVGVSAGCSPELGQSHQGVQQHYRYVLVHGSFQGPYVWNQVAQHLQAEGEDVTVVTLPGHYTDMTPPSEITMSSYVARVAEAVHSGSMPVHLVGHSMAGMVISQFAENEPSAVKDLVYFAALLPQDGQTILDVAGPDTGSLAIQYINIDFTNQIVTLPVERLQEIFCADCSANQMALLTSNYRPDPLPPAFNPVHLTAANWGSVSKRYLYASQDVATSYPWQLQMTAAVTLDKTATITSSHEAQVSHAGQFTDVLIDLVK